MEIVKINGCIKKVKKLENDFNIIFFKPKDMDVRYITDKGTYVVQGYGSFVEGENIEFDGEWMYNKKHNNWVFKFIGYEREKPDKVEDIAYYLQSFVFKGVGPVLANKIVAKFKEDTLDIIDKTPERLLEIDGIGAKKYKKLMESYTGNESYKKLTQLLVVPPISMSANLVNKIYKELGSTAVQKIEENPYILCEKVSRLGFKTADTVARLKFNIDTKSIERMRAGITYILKEAATQNGHLYLPINELYLQFRKIFPELTLEDYKRCIKILNNADIKIVNNSSNLNASPVYLRAFYNIECNVAENIKKLAFGGKKIKSIKKYIKELESKFGIQYAEKQKEALEKVGQTNFLVVTGGPGTGKSTIIKGILGILDKHDPMCNILMAAPTGRASKRMEETTGREAKTIHRLLEYNPAEGFGKDEENKIDADVIIIDEFSMVDILLMNNLMKAVKTSTKLILIGDIDQLPSVGPGTVLKDIINSGIIPVTRLNQVYRQGEDSKINTNARKISEGITDIRYDSNEFVLIEDSVAKNVQEAVVYNFIEEMFNEKENSGSIEKALYNVQILTPTKQGMLGTVELNNVIQSKINPNHGTEVIFNYKDKEGEDVSIRYRTGDKVQQTKNNYEKDVYNGDLGIITNIEKDDDDFIIQVSLEDGRVVEYAKEELKGELVLAYATTIHKSQGSEYKVVIQLASSVHSFMNYRNLLYTGITRAKKKVILCGEKEAVVRSIKTSSPLERYTRLTELLK